MLYLDASQYSNSCLSVILNIEIKWASIRFRFYLILVFFTLVIIYRTIVSKIYNHSVCVCADLQIHIIPLFKASLHQVFSLLQKKKNALVLCSKLIHFLV